MAHLDVGRTRDAAQRRRFGFGVTTFILDYGGDPRTLTGSGSEFVAVDKAGNVFDGEPCPRVLRKYVKVR